MRWDDTIHGGTIAKEDIWIWILVICYVGCLNNGQLRGRVRPILCKAEKSVLEIFGHELLRHKSVVIHISIYLLIDACIFYQCDKLGTTQTSSRILIPSGYTYDFMCANYLNQISSREGLATLW